MDSANVTFFCIIIEDFTEKIFELEYQIVLFVLLRCEHKEIQNMYVGRGFHLLRRPWEMY